MKHRVIGRFLLLVAVTTSWITSPAQNPILGVLEENQGHAGDANYRRSVRVVFEKKGDEWIAFQHDCDVPECLRTVTSRYPHEVKWTVAFDGRSVGHVVSRAPSDFRWYSDVGQQEIVSGAPVPTIGSRSAEFGGYTDQAVYRPLVANSRPYFTDPDGWKPVVVSPELVRLLRDSFRMTFPTLCRTNPSDETKLEPYPYRDDEVKVVKAYASRSGTVVVELHLEASDCHDTEAGFDMDNPWFFVDTKKSARYLHSGMWLVDAGDYDGDGRSELIFSIDRENRGGYEIWYDGFRKNAVFQFGYH